jgi:DNA-binding transcriptional LysR family regulator
LDRKIRAFLAIVEEGTLTAAANRIGLAQPSLSKFLQRLEKEVGAKLFERKMRGMELTSFGQAFLARARRIEAEYKFATEEIAAMKHGGLPHLRIGAGPLYHMLHLPNALTSLVREFPGTRIEVFAENNRMTMPRLQRGEIDLVCGEIESEQALYGMETVELLTADIGLIMRPDHPQAGLEMTPEALAAQTYVVFQNDDRAQAQLARYLGARGFDHRVAVSTSSFATGLMLARATDYVMLAPAQLRSVIEEAGLIVRAPQKPIRQFATGVTLRSSSREIPIVARLIDLLRRSTAAPAA